MGDIAYLHKRTSLPVPVDRVLQGAQDADLACVLVIGKEQNGEYYYACSHCEKGELLLHMERFKKYLLELP